MTNKPISVLLLPSTGYSGNLMPLFYFTNVFVCHKVYFSHPFKNNILIVCFLEF